MGFALGIGVDPVAFLACVPFMLLITFGMVSIGLMIASLMGSLESFGAVQSFINLPLFFLSGALFPIQSLPDWMQTIAKLDPLTYGVNALRTIILGGAWQADQVQPLVVDLAIIGVFDLVMIAIRTWAFGKMK